MESLSSSVFISNLPEFLNTQFPPTSSSSLSSSCWLIKGANKRIGSLKFNSETSHFQGFRLQALSREVPSEDEDEPQPLTLNNGFPSVSEDSLSVSKGDLVHNKTSDKDVDKSLKLEAPLTVPHGSGASGGTRAGLFRTPISGGVQSATSAHGLPRPALAVRNLMEQARFAHLCTVMSRMHHRREGYPFGSLVDFAPDSMGHPIFSFSPLAIHTRNLLADPRCTLVVQIPGWSGLSNARVTIFGDVYPLPEHQQEWAHKQYIAKHQQGPSQQWGNFYYFRMRNISDIYFIGGFGTVAWVDVKEYEALQPDKIAVDGGEQNLKELNSTFSKPLKELLSTEAEVDDAALISIDSKGIDIRVRQGAQFNVQRLSFEEGHAIETLDDAKAALWKVIKKGQVDNLKRYEL
ncbi:FMN-binding split barrel [Corchorus capsularis]|uniref:FMN-binding split barrel n=1 Tax=Corchorus capsularis TaxID=210143 RepID=A0A1R3I0M2_COCAP|nr:FMN-binding split barrel [Corchorus capsularis]